MDEELIHQPDTNEKPLFSGLNMAWIAEQLKNPVLFHEASQENGSSVSTINRDPDFDVEPGNQSTQTTFGGLHLAEVHKTFSTHTASNPGKKSNENNHVPVTPPSLEIRPSKVSTADVIASYMKIKQNKRVKPSTMTTYEKRFRLFEQRFPFLPETPEEIMDYLSRFDGESGRHRRNTQDLIKMLYMHATSRFGLLKNPVDELERPLVTRKPLKTLSLEQILALNPTPENLQERIALDLFIGHGWRQVEPRRIQARDVAAIDQQLILCHGKEREELAPLLPETADRLRELARGLEPDNFLFVAQQTRHGRRAPLGEDGMSQLIGRLLARAGLKGFTGHDLRRTFATLVTTASHDEFLAMRLIRDRVPGQSDRYVNYPMAQLVEALEKYSPIRQIEKGPRSNNTGADNQKVSAAIKVSPVLETGEITNNVSAETVKSLVETGEGRTPPDIKLNSFSGIGQ